MKSQHINPFATQVIVEAGTVYSQNLITPPNGGIFVSLSIDNSKGNSNLNVQLTGIDAGAVAYMIVDAGVEYNFHRGDMDIVSVGLAVVESGGTDNYVQIVGGYIAK